MGMTMPRYSAAQVPWSVQPSQTLIRYLVQLLSVSEATISANNSMRDKHRSDGLIAKALLCDNTIAMVRSRSCSTTPSLADQVCKHKDIAQDLTVDLVRLHPTPLVGVVF